jgi:hypothetical protein
MSAAFKIAEDDHYNDLSVHTVRHRNRLQDSQGRR